MHPLDIFFWACLMLGAVYTFASLLMGGFSHLMGDTGDLADVSGAAHGADAGHAGHMDAGQACGHVDPSTFAGHVDGGHAPVGHASDGHIDGHDQGDHGDLRDGVARFNILSYLSPIAVSGFLLGFGGVGVFARLVGSSHLVSVPLAAASGAALYYGCYWLSHCMFGRSQGTSHSRREDVIGLRARVVAPIDGRQPGMVSYTIGGSRQSLPAVTDDEKPIPMGATVRIQRVEEHKVSVMRLD